MASNPKIIETGRRAFFSGLTRRANAFAIGSQARADWFKGYRSAQKGYPAPQVKAPKFNVGDKVHKLWDGKPGKLIYTVNAIAPDADENLAGCISVASLPELMNARVWENARNFVPACA